MGENLKDKQMFTIFSEIIFTFIQTVVDIELFRLNLVTHTPKRAFSDLLRQPAFLTH